MKSIKISGKVVSGQGYGRKLGFPTANLDRRDYKRRKLKIKLGIYAGFAAYQLKAISYKLKAAIVIGPIDKTNLPKIEAHLLGFKGNLYGRKITLDLLKYVRAFKQFKTEKQLQSQIKKDIKIIKNIKFQISNAK